MLVNKSYTGVKLALTLQSMKNGGLKQKTSLKRALVVNRDEGSK